MGRLGLEPRTNRLKAEYSTIELATLEQFVFCSHTLTSITWYLKNYKKNV